MTGFTFRERLVLLPQAPLHTQEARTLAREHKEQHQNKKLMSLFSSNQRRGRSSSRSPPLFSSFSLLVLAVATFLTIVVPSKVAASKTKNRAILKEKYGIDCGTHCTNAVVKLHEAKIEQEKCVRFFFLFARRIFLFVFGVFVVVVLLSFFLSLSCAA
jgi:hypothetical protein